jgi:hypothetical protein
MEGYTRERPPGEVERNFYRPSLGVRMVYGYDDGEPHVPDCVGGPFEDSWWKQKPQKESKSKK